MTMAGERWNLTGLPEGKGRNRWGGGGGEGDVLNNKPA